MEHPTSAPTGPHAGPLTCPRCGEPLGHREMGPELQLSGRPCNGPQGCGGVWYRHSTFEHLKEQAKKAGLLSLDSDSGPNTGPSGAFPGPASAPVIHCPECAEPMAQRHFRFEGRATPIVLDDCAPHGLWFDPEELEAALQVVRSHAQALARHRSPADPADSAGTSPGQNPTQRKAATHAPSSEPGTIPQATPRQPISAAPDNNSSAVAATEFFADVTLGALFAIFFE